MSRAAASFPAIEPDSGWSTVSNRSRDVDALLAELDFVLNCRCCAPRDRAFAVEDWAASDAVPSEASWLFQ